jgi:hypothetical protein
VLKEFYVMQTASQLRFSSASNRLAACPGRRRAVLARIAEAEAPAATAPPPPPPAPHRAMLLKKFKAHDASVTALSVLDDAPGGLPSGLAGWFKWI